MLEKLRAIISNLFGSAPEMAAPPVTVPVSRPATCPAKILCIEGHAAMRELLVQLLDQETDYELAVASTGPEGIRSACEWQPDLIIMGLRLPQLNGFEVIKRIRQNPTTHEIPIIVLSAWNSAKHKSLALEAGAQEHLTPPIETKRLVRHIEKYLRS